MKLVIFGLTVTSSWGNGHATLWRGLCKALGRRGHRVVFFERDVPYYASHRDLADLEGGTLVLYRDLGEILPQVRRELADADVAMTTSYCPDAILAAEEIGASRARVKAFYDLDTPVTLAALDAGEHVPYLPARGLADFDLVLSYTGGGALSRLISDLGARRVVPLHGHVDPETHHPAAPVDRYLCDLSYLGTYADDRQATLDALFLTPARRLPRQRFLIGGAKYPEGFPWLPQLFFVEHVPPPEHPAFFGSSRLTLNVTRRVMAAFGHCPSGRLFEAAACGCPIVSDAWDGLDAFYHPGEEILVARYPEEVVDALELTDTELRRIAGAARERTLTRHTSDHRAGELEAAVEGVLSAPSCTPVRPVSLEGSAQGWA
jgi:spore maturation protein CgeB